MKGLIPRYQPGGPLDIAKMQSDFLQNTDYVKANKDGVSFMTRKGKKVFAAMEELKKSNSAGDTYKYDPLKETYKVFNKETSKVNANSGLKTDESRLNLHTNKGERQSHRLNKEVSKLIPKYATSKEAIEEAVNKEVAEKPYKTINLKEDVKKEEGENTKVGSNLQNLAAYKPFKFTPSSTSSSTENATDYNKYLGGFNGGNPLTNSTLVKQHTWLSTENPVATNEELKELEKKIKSSKIIPSPIVFNNLKGQLDSKNTNRPIKLFKKGGALVTKHQSFSMLGGGNGVQLTNPGLANPFQTNVLDQYKLNGSFDKGSTSSSMYLPESKMYFTPSKGLTRPNLTLDSKFDLKKTIAKSIMPSNSRLSQTLYDDNYFKAMRLRAQNEQNQKVAEVANENLNIERQGIVKRGLNVNLSGVAGKVAPHLGLIANTAGNIGQLAMALKAAKEPIARIEPVIQKNAAKQATPTVLAEQSLLTNDQIRAASKINPNMNTADPNAQLIGSNLANAQKQAVLANMATQQGAFRGQERARVVAGMNQFNAVEAMNRNSDIDLANRNNASIQDANLKNALALKEQKERRYAAIGGFIGNTMQGIGTHIDNRSNLKFAARLEDTKNKFDAYKTDKTYLAYAKMQNPDADVTDLNSNAEESKKAYEEADAAVRKKYFGNV